MWLILFESKCFLQITSEVFCFCLICTYDLAKNSYCAKQSWRAVKTLTNQMVRRQLSKQLNLGDHLALHFQNAICSIVFTDNRYIPCTSFRGSQNLCHIAVIYRISPHGGFRTINLYSDVQLISGSFHKLLQDVTSVLTWQYLMNVTVAMLKKLWMFRE